MRNDEITTHTALDFVLGIFVTDFYLDFRLSLDGLRRGRIIVLALIAALNYAILLSNPMLSTSLSSLSSFSSLHTQQIKLATKDVYIGT